MKKITKAVFPVAGLGSRFLPATKASPKEMLPIVDKPLIQYAVEEAAAAGITDMIFVTGRNKRAIEDHFDKAYELEAELAARNKTELLRDGAAASPPGHQLHLHPPGRGARARAMRCCARARGRRRAVRRAARRRPDRRASVPVLKQMTEPPRVRGLLGDRREEVPRDETGSYGIVETGRDGRARWTRSRAIVEKPAAGTQPSTLAVVGRYVLTPRIFEHLRAMPPGRGRRDPAHRRDRAAARRGARAGVCIRGRRYDCGTKLGYLEATVDYGLQAPRDRRRPSRAFLRDKQLPR